MNHLFEAQKFGSLAVTVFLVGWGFLGTSTAGVPDTEAERIETLLNRQVVCWNQEDLDGFMETYWKSNRLTFSSGGKTTRGWQATLDQYKKSYPAGSMGKLHFDGLEVDLLSKQVALVLGHWHLDDRGVKKDGNFSLVLKKIEGQWKIVHDHSSRLKDEK